MAKSIIDFLPKDNAVRQRVEADEERLEKAFNLPSGTLSEVRSKTSRRRSSGGGGGGSSRSSSPTPQQLEQERKAREAEAQRQRIVSEEKARETARQIAQKQFEANQGRTISGQIQQTPSIRSFSEADRQAFLKQEGGVFRRGFFDSARDFIRNPKKSFGTIGPTVQGGRTDKGFLDVFKFSEKFQKDQPVVVPIPQGSVSSFDTNFPGLTTKGQQQARVEAERDFQIGLTTRKTDRLIQTDLNLNQIQTQNKINNLVADKFQTTQSSLTAFDRDLQNRVNSGKLSLDRARDLQRNRYSQAQQDLDTFSKSTFETQTAIFETSNNAILDKRNREFQKDIDNIYKANQDVIKGTGGRTGNVRKGIQLGADITATTIGGPTALTFFGSRAIIRGSNVDKQSTFGEKAGVAVDFGLAGVGGAQTLRQSGQNVLQAELQSKLESINQKPIKFDQKAVIDERSGLFALRGSRREGNFLQEFETKGVFIKKGNQQFFKAQGGLDFRTTGKLDFRTVPFTDPKTNVFFVEGGKATTAFSGKTVPILDGKGAFTTGLGAVKPQFSVGALAKEGGTPLGSFRTQGGIVQSSFGSGFGFRTGKNKVSSVGGETVFDFGTGKATGFKVGSFGTTEIKRVSFLDDALGLQGTTSSPTKIFTTGGRKTPLSTTFGQTPAQASQAQAQQASLRSSITDFASKQSQASSQAFSGIRQPSRSFFNPTLQTTTTQTRTRQITQPQFPVFQSPLTKSSLSLNQLSLTGVTTLQGSTTRTEQGQASRTGQTQLQPTPTITPTPTVPVPVFPEIPRQQPIPRRTNFPTFFFPRISGLPQIRNNRRPAIRSGTSQNLSFNPSFTASTLKIRSPRPKEIKGIGINPFAIRGLSPLKKKKKKKPKKIRIL